VANEVDASTLFMGIHDHGLHHVKTESEFVSYTSNLGQFETFASANYNVIPHYEDLFVRQNMAR